MNVENETLPDTAHTVWLRNISAENSIDGI